MEDADIEKKPGNWQPTTDKIELAILGKMVEEANELGSAGSRCIIQGIDAKEPVTRKVNRRWLEDEIADVIAMTQLAIEHYDLDRERMHARVEAKKRHKRAWHEMLRQQKDAS